jgi:hypothetical protein
MALATVPPAMSLRSVPPPLRQLGTLLLATALASACQCGSHLAAADGLVASPPALDFGDVTVDTEAVKTLTLTNQGSANVQLESGAVGGDADFQLQGFTSSTLGPGDSVQLHLSFTPSSIGPHSGALTVVTDVSDSPDTVVQLTGVGVTGSVVDAGPDAGTPPPAADAGGVGCADGTREGFLDQTHYPAIAACSGAWSVPGVDQSNAAGTTCNRQGGNTPPANTEGTGCSAVDLCAVGWHICNGYQEVATAAPTGCGDAIPPGSACASDDCMFAIAQHSCNDTVCNDNPSSCTLTGDDDDNDVEGCGNLGDSLTQANNQCGPLNAAFASEQPNSCGWNQAMPQLGPWQCNGSNSYNEGDYVTKNGCPSCSCSEGGQAFCNSDKGGVLCCAD